MTRQCFWSLHVYEREKVNEEIKDKKKKMVSAAFFKIVDNALSMAEECILELLHVHYTARQIFFLF